MSSVCIIKHLWSYWLPHQYLSPPVNILATQSIVSHETIYQQIYWILIVGSTQHFRWKIHGTRKLALKSHILAWTNLRQAKSEFIMPTTSGSVSYSSSKHSSSMCLATFGRQWRAAASRTSSWDSIHPSWAKRRKPRIATCSLNICTGTSTITTRPFTFMYSLKRSTWSMLSFKCGSWTDSLAANSRAMAGK